MKKLTAPKYFVEKQKEATDQLAEALEVANIDKTIVDMVRAGLTRKRLAVIAMELAKAEDELVKSKRWLVNCYLQRSMSTMELAWAELSIKNPSLWNQGAMRYIPEEGKIEIKPTVKSFVDDMAKQFKKTFGIRMGDE